MARAKRKPIRTLIVTLIAIVLAIAAVFAAINVYVVASTRTNVHTISQIEESGIKVDAIVVFGASVFADATPSDILADRLEVAVDLFKAGASDAIIVSGDNRDSHYNESDAMKSYCVEMGVPADCVLVDRAGYDTYASVWRAQNIYGADSVILVTQGYHLYRAIAIAQGLGMEAYGIAADKGEYDNQLGYSTREALARVKDFFQTLVRAMPEDADQPITR